MPASDIVIKGAREHNLRDVHVVLPRNQLICLTGVSGSGKSSLAFDTLYAEGQRRYVESLSSFARQFLGQMPKPDVDYIGGLSPSISISQKTAGNNPRSTVGTITQIYDYLRVLYARVGHGYCPSCERPIAAQTREQIIARILQLPAGTRLAVLAPLIRGQRGEYRDLFEDLLKQGFVRARVDGRMVQLTEDLQLDRQMRHDIEVVADRLVMRTSQRSRLAEAVELAMKVGRGNLIVTTETEAGSDKEADSRKPKRPGERVGDMVLSANYACSHCELSFEPPSPQMFSFNSPQGMCLECDGLGKLYTFCPVKLIPDPRLSVKQGCFELLGRLADMGRWKRHIYQGVAETVQRVRELEPGTMLETPWENLDQNLQESWLWGTDQMHVTYTWRGGQRPQKYGGTWEGIIPELLSKYRNSQSKLQIRQLEQYMTMMLCPDCHGQRLNPQARSVRIRSAHSQFRDSRSSKSAPDSGWSLPRVCSLPVADAANFFSQLELDQTGQLIAAEALKEIQGRLGFLMNVGLGYLTLDRTAPSLSGGESQRIRLAGQIGSGLVGVLYILDEPSIGLHPRDNSRLLATLGQLRDMGNTVVVVEHDEDTMRAADHLIDFGPGPGVRGGQVVAEGTLSDVIKQPRSVTGQYLSAVRQIAIPDSRRMPSVGPDAGGRVKQNGKRPALPKTPAGSWLQVIGARHNNLKDVAVDIPLGAFVCVTGVSGSGKSSLVNDIIVQALCRDLNGGQGHPGEHRQIKGLENLDKMIAIDQAPIGRTPRSNPSTYTKVFDDIRALFSQLPDSKRRGYKPGRFSFNVKSGRCEACEGNGSTRLEMDFLADVWVTCPVCEGRRFNRETLQVQFKGKSISDVLEMDVQQAVTLFENIPKIHHKLKTLHDVGLDYLKLGQPSPTLSGGEAQRIKLARELVKKSTGKTLYLLDEPTTGLHFADIELLLKVLHGFVDAGNTVLVVEHNLDIVKTADWIIDLGPEGGEAGGYVLATGTPEDVAAQTDSYTGQELAHSLNGRNRSVQPSPTRPAKSGRASSAAAKRTQNITISGARQHNLKNIDVEIPRDQMTVFCGPSGSGKSSLAMDTIYAEGQRRYVESLSAYARQFVSQMQKPQLDHIDGLSPAIAIEQKNLGHTPRSTVGTVTEIYDYFRILLARLGTPRCPDCDIPVGTQTSDEVVDKVMDHPPGTKLYLSAPVHAEVGQRYESIWDEVRQAGYVRIRVDGKTFSLDSPPTIDRRRKHQVEVVIDRIVVRPKSRGRIADSIEGALALGRGILHVAYPQEDQPEEDWPVIIHSQHLSCDRCGRSFQRLSPHNFSFNSSLGWCTECEGLGTQIGANPALLLRDPKLTLAEGAVSMWPDLEANANSNANVNLTISRMMLEALAAGTGVPIDVPFEKLSAGQRRHILHGTGEKWFDVEVGDSAAPAQRTGSKVPRQCLFRFQFKGLYPALDDASRISPAFRGRLDRLIDEVACSVCDGSRLRDDAASMRIRNQTLGQLCRMPFGELLSAIRRWKLNSRELKIAGEVVREIDSRVQFLCDVGLEYLTLGRPAATLSGGEFQRIRLAGQLGSGLCGVLYVLDEPTIGLHARDNARLLAALHRLRDLGNTLIVVEHDREVIRHSDQICDFGPGAGREGGRIVAQAAPDRIAKRRGSVTGPYLSGKKAIPIPTNRRDHVLSGTAMEVTNARRDKRRATRKSKPSNSGHLTVIGARQNNLRNVNLRIPLGTFTAVTGVSGSGKSSLIDNVLYNSLARMLHRARTKPGLHDRIEGVENINKVIRVDQQSLGNSPTSNPATYTGVFDLIRELFAQLPEAKLRGYTLRRFSFNVPGGRCEECEGNGQVCIEMHFLPDVWVECDTCQGRRYNPETLAVQFHGQSISDVLDMPCGQALKLFQNIPKIRRILQTLIDVGLDYVKLGQPAPTLSGGEAQRVKLASELSRPDTGRTLYLLDEPTTGLHFDDLAKLLEVLHRLVDLGNTVIVIEHNLDVIKSADWVIDMGPEAGDGGGWIVAEGTPEDVVSRALESRSATAAGKRSHRSYTGEVLGPILESGPHQVRKRYDPQAQHTQEGDLDIRQVGRDQKMPWQLDGPRWHTVDRVGRDSQPCRWEGRILQTIIERIQKIGDFSATNWDSRSVVEIAAKKKTSGWFFHAITGETWLLKMKFRVARNTFRRDTLINSLGLKPLNQIDDLPVYGNDPRVRCKALRAPWQEVQIRVHRFDEIDTPAFWQFLDDAIGGFTKVIERTTQKPQDIMPWKVLGEKWHLSRKGFRPGKRVLWDVKVLQKLCDLLRKAASDAEFIWTNQQVVHVLVDGRKEPWASIRTKSPASVELILSGPKGNFALGRIARLGRQRQFDGIRDDRDLVKLKFRSSNDFKNGDLTDFLSEHRESLKTAASTGSAK